VDRKAECGQLNLAHVIRNKNVYKKEGTKTNKRQYRFKIRGGRPEGRKTMEERIVKEMSFKSGVKERGSDRW